MDLGAALQYHGIVRIAAGTGGGNHRQYRGTHK